MRNVRLKSLTLVNFRGERERTTEFGPRVTVISGANGLGKSRHFDAFVWLLFGKDSLDRKDYEVRSRVGGEPLHQCECSVTGVLDIDGTEITLKRAFNEEWVKPRGQTEQVFRGNRTECWWNGAPVNVTEYERRVGEIAGAEVFKTLSNPDYFPNMDWRMMREHLFLLAGDVTDGEIAARNADFARLLETMGGKPLADFKAELAARKRRLKAELAEIQPRIDQTEKTRPEAEDFASLERRLSEIDDEIGTIDAGLADIAVSQREARKAADERTREISRLRRECDDLVREAEDEARAAARKANAARDALGGRIAEMESGLRAAGTTGKEIEAAERDLAAKETRIGDLRKEWHRVSGSVWEGATVCPQCGQALPAGMVDDARRMFEDDRKRRLSENQDAGRSLKAEIEGLRATLAGLLERRESEEAERKAAGESLRKMREEYDATEPERPRETDPRSISGWVTAMERIAELEKEDSATGRDGRADGMLSRKAALNAERAKVAGSLAKRAQAERCDLLVEELKGRGRELSQMLADAEREEFTLGEFNRAKADECESRVNSMFRTVTFRLFDYTQEGNAVETCVPLVGGVPYGSANSAGRTNAGLDIIATLCGHYGLRVPVFIDHAESVNEFFPLESQTILLTVSGEGELNVTREEE